VCARVCVCVCVLYMWSNPSSLAMNTLERVYIL